MDQSYEDAARILVEARSQVLPIQGLPESLRPVDILSAYRIQDAAIVLMDQRMGQPVVGWKVGATAQQVQQLLGVSEPFAGPLFKGGATSTPAVLPKARYNHRAIESEFAFRFARTLDPRADPYSRDEVVSAVDAVVPAIELISPAFEKIFGGHIASGIADFALSAGIVTGQPYADWAALDLPGFSVSLRIDGAVVAQGKGSMVLGDPVVALVWLVNHLSERGRSVPAGALVSTGTMTGLVELEPGQTAVADFGPLGDVSVCFE